MIDVYDFQQSIYFLPRHIMNHAACMNYEISKASGIIDNPHKTSWKPFSWRSFGRKIRTGTIKCTHW